MVKIIDHGTWALTATWNRPWYWACVVGPDRPLARAPMPAAGGTDVRTASYEATQKVTEPFGPARIGLDAAADVLPGPADATATWAAPGWSSRNTAGGVYPYRGIPRYEIPCTVTGTVEVGGERFEIDAYGAR
ncbi:hypothetical protein GCM10010191_13030 [Actinomadura vinacea]|uniref:Uncharacterized protein n=2 Tax=Actinomadura vinacea TaxID=115336 RepID=A0ABN3IJH7_9ACTN